jgi:hypothetical protein
MKCRIDGCDNQSESPICSACTPRWTSSPEYRRYEYFEDYMARNSNMCAARVAFVDWVTRVNAERRNSQ